VPTEFLVGTTGVVFHDSTHGQREGPPEGRTVRMTLVPRARSVVLASLDIRGYENWAPGVAQDDCGAPAVAGSPESRMIIRANAKCAGLRACWCALNKLGSNTLVVNELLYFVKVF
jgi:hypothetical protein